MNIRHLYWGIVLILLGVLGLGVTLGWFPNVNIWGLLGPFFLIAIGIWLLIRPRVPKHATHFTGEDAIALDDAQEAKITFEHGAGKLNLSGGAAQGNLLEGIFSSRVRKKVSRDGSSLKVKLESDHDFLDGGMDWDVRLNDFIPLTLKLETGASELICDLSDLIVKELELKTGASSSSFKLPGHAGFTLLDIDAGAASLDLTVPEGVAASIMVEAPMMKKVINDARFPFNGSRYESAEYASAENKVEIRIDSAVGSISVH